MTKQLRKETEGQNDPSNDTLLETSYKYLTTQMDHVALVSLITNVVKIKHHVTEI